VIKPAVQSHIDNLQFSLQSKIDELGPDHIDLVDDFSGLGLCYQHMAEDLDKALKFHQEALRILKKCSVDATGDVSEVHRKMAVTLTDLGFIHEKLASFQQALEDFHEARRLLKLIHTKESDHKLQSCRFATSRLTRCSSLENEDVGPDRYDFSESCPDIHTYKYAL
jgi:tetratricopeptide (TPR) repeat protein